MLHQWKNKKSVYKDNKACFYMLANYELGKAKFGITIRNIKDRIQYAKQGYVLQDVRFGTTEQVYNAEQICKAVFGGMHEYGGYLEILDIYHKASSIENLERVVLYSDMLV